MKRGFYAALAAMLLLLGIPARADSGLSAQNIVDRWRAASGITEQHSQTTFARYEVSRYGRTMTEAVVTKAPDHFWMKTDYAWRHFVEFEGYDGKDAWTADSFGAAGPAGDTMRRLILSQAAWYNDAPMFAGRMKMTMQRLPDATLQGRTFYAVQFSQDAALTVTLYFDRQTFWLTGYSYDPNRYDLCLDESRDANGIVTCKMLMAYENGRADTIIRLIEMRYGAQIDDAQFSPQGIPQDDGQTAALVQRYAAAMGDLALHSPYTLLGDGRFTNDRFPDRFWGYAWKLALHPPDRYDLTSISRQGHKSTASYDGQKGFVRTYDGKTTDATEINSLSSLIVNHCAARPAECALTVRHLPDVHWQGATYETLGFWNTADPSRYGVMLLDPMTSLPYAAYSQLSLAIFTHWAHGDSGVRYPTDIDLQQPWTDMHVTNIVAGPPGA